MTELNEWEKELRENSWDTEKGIMTKELVIINGAEYGNTTIPVTLDMVISKIKTLLDSQRSELMKKVEGIEYDGYVEHFREKVIALLKE